MRQTIFTLLIACTWSLLCYAQTPYDSFAPEAYRPMLELEEPNQQLDTIFSVVVADLENRMLLLMNVLSGEILVAIPLPDDISKWLSVDPLSDKYPSVSPYAYCHWSPLVYVDHDGRDDLFDGLGTFLKHIDNGTDFVMIQKSNGEQQNITDFFYGDNYVANKEMLGNIMTYYAQRVGLNQEIGILENPKGGESAMFATQKRQVFMVVNGGRINLDASTSNNIMNSLVHESDHYRKGTSGAIAEVEAIVTQITHPTWNNTTESYKAAIINYLVNNANSASEKGILVQTYLAPIMPILDVSPFSVFLNNNSYSIFINSPEK